MLPDSNLKVKIDSAVSTMLLCPHKKRKETFLFLTGNEIIKFICKEQKERINSTVSKHSFNRMKSSDFNKNQRKQVITNLQQ